MFVLWQKLSTQVWRKVKGTIFYYIHIFLLQQNKFTLLLCKGVFLYQYIDDWKKLYETSLPEIDNSYNQLNMEDITNSDYMHAKRVCKGFEMKHLREYHDLYQYIIVS